MVSSLYDRQAGEYSHGQLSCTLGAAEAHRVLARCHSQLFSQWLGFNLAEQQIDLEEFLARPSNKPDWSRIRDLVPVTAADADRDLFLTDLETLRELRDHARRGDA